ncbi:MAG: TGS domain-containing protein, partial [Alphaproteobacteria bacterium]|nr:TGS domain-containing protein [Alphaproteobacteria bacterium]
MVAITLPDGSTRNYPGPVSGADIAMDIGPGLAKAALAVRVEGVMRDLSSVIDGDANVSIVTAKDADALELLRHDAAHVMAEAVQELFPDAQVTFGPATENGFYYDFARATPFTPDDLERIETRMKEIVERNETIVREVWSRERATAFFKDKGEAYKAEWVAELPGDAE